MSMSTAAETLPKSRRTVMRVSISAIVTQATAMGGRAPSHNGFAAFSVSNNDAGSVDFSATGTTTGPRGVRGTMMRASLDRVRGDQSKSYGYSAEGDNILHGSFLFWADDRPHALQPFQQTTPAGSYSASLENILNEDVRTLFSDRPRGDRRLLCRLRRAEAWPFFMVVSGFGICSGRFCMAAHTSSNRRSGAGVRGLRRCLYRHLAGVALACGIRAPRPMGRGWRHFVPAGSRHHGAGAPVIPFAASPGSGGGRIACMARSPECDHWFGRGLAHFSTLCFIRGAIRSFNPQIG